MSGGAQPPRIGMSQKSMDRTVVEFGPCVSAETVKACALILIGLHKMSEENALRSDSDSCPDLGEMWRDGCPKKKPCVEHPRMGGK